MRLPDMIARVQGSFLLWKTTYMSLPRQKTLCSLSGEWISGRKMACADRSRDLVHKPIVPMQEFFRRYSMEDIGLLVEDIMTHLLIVSEQELLKELSVVSMMYGIGVMGKVILMEVEWIMVYL